MRDNGHLVFESWIPPRYVVQPSLCHITNPDQPKTLFKIELDNNESAFSVAVVPFMGRENELFLVVGTAKETRVSPRSCTTGYLRTYKILEDGKRLELLHQVRSLVVVMRCES